MQLIEKIKLATACATILINENGCDDDDDDDYDDDDDDDDDYYDHDDDESDVMTT